MDIVTRIIHGFHTMNANLVTPIKAIKDKLALNVYLPRLLEIPIVYLLTLCMFLFNVITATNNLLGNIIGIVYPLSVREHVNEQLLNKYWCIFNGLTLIDILFGFILHSIPGYFFLRTSFILALMRNNFALVDIVHDKLPFDKARPNDPIDKPIAIDPTN